MKAIFIFRLIILFNFILTNNLFSLNDALKIKLLNSTYSDEAVVRFLPNALPSFDSNYDAWKLFSSNNLIPAIYTKIDSASFLSINALPIYDSKQEIPLYVKITTPGAYTFQSIELGLFSANTSVFLEDKYTGMHYNFRNGASVSVYLHQTALTDSNRFVLHFSPPTLVNVVDVSCNGLEDGLISIKKNGNSDWSAIIKNSSDSIVSSALLINDSITFYSLPSGAYTLYTFSNFTTPDSTPFVINQPNAIVADFVLLSNSITISTPITFFNNCENAQYYLWNFGDGSPLSSEMSPTHQYSSAGQYNITLIAFSENCSVNFSDSLEIIPDVATSQVNSAAEENSLIAFQSDNVINIDLKLSEALGRIFIYNVEGKILYNEIYSSIRNQYLYTPLVSGVYMIVVNVGNQHLIKKINFIK